ncbi:MAG: hypothetical protein SGI91_15810 [Alphaproteobacteria bacterium]|nr:hypothetical protein [Alphaproteobacteria bacterium]
MSELDAWLIVGATVLVAVAAIFGEYVWRRLTGRWPPKERGAGIAGTAAIIAGNSTSADDKDTEGGDGGSDGD